MRFLLTPLLTTALALAGPAEAQVETASREGDPIEMLIEIGPELELTAAQVERLRGIQRDLDERNRPLVDRLLEIQRRVQNQLTEAEASRRGVRRPSRAHLEMARAPMRQIQVNTFRAMGAIGEVLNRDQKRTAAELLDLPGVDRRWRGDRFR